MFASKKIESITAMINKKIAVKHHQQNSQQWFGIKTTF